MENKQINLKDQVLGCFLGGAVGDALGAPFEGLWAESIPPTFFGRKKPSIPAGIYSASTETGRGYYFRALIPSRP